MGVLKHNLSGDYFVGAFGVATDKFALLGHRVSANEEKLVQDMLEVETHKITISGSELIGIYSVANSNGLLLPNITEEHEVRDIKSKLKVNVHVMSTDLNALRNNILVNDKVAIINPDYHTNDAKEIEDVLGVEVIRLGIGGFKTVGANNIATNKGIVLNNKATEEQQSMMKDIFGSVSNSTANLGSPSIGLCAMANSKGLIVGEQTTGFEMARMSQGLDIE